MLAIYKKELRSYFTNPLGFVFVGIFLAVSALLFSYTTFLSKTYDTSSYFLLMIFVLVLLLPLLTMRLFAEEKKLRTEQLLLTAPISLTGMVLGKFFAAFTMFFGCMLVSCINLIPLYAIAAAERGNLSYSTTYVGPVTAQIVGSMIAIILIGAAFIALGTLVSTLTENQLAAAIITMAAIFGLIFTSLISSFVPVVWIRTALNWISVLGRFSNLSSGVFDIAAVVYYLSLTFVFLFLTVRVYEKRRWN
ncbi:MAG: ABC transporter [Clostridia bacterium]|nr:ABC transporter [Clostridia bacterium]MBR4032722.1 ABC transporter [Clostridia bacterium]